MSLKTICLLKAFLHSYYADNDAKSMVKHLIFLRKLAVLQTCLLTVYPALFTDNRISPFLHLAKRKKKERKDSQVNLSSHSTAILLRVVKVINGISFVFPSNHWKPINSLCSFCHVRFFTSPHPNRRIYVSRRVSLSVCRSVRRSVHRSVTPP